MSLLDYVRVLRRGWWVILLATGLGVLAAAAWTAAASPRYQAQATVYVSVTGDATPTDLASGNAFTNQRVATYADLAMTSAVIDRAASSIDDPDVAQLRASVVSRARLEKSLIDITASGSDSQDVAARANAVAEALTATAALLDTPGSASPVRLTVVQSAEPPETPLTPRPLNNVLIGAAVGLVLGVAIVVVADALSTRIRSSADLPRAAGLATLTSMPSGPERRLRHLATTDARVESFRQLRANLQFGSHVEETIAVAGVTAASDAHAVAYQLAAAFAEIGASVVAVDLDLRPNSIRNGGGAWLDQAPSPLGVADVLGGAVHVDDVVTKVAGSDFYEVPAGRADSSSAQRMSTPVMREVLQTLAARFDYVVLACPPLVERSESAVAAALAGSALVVVESGATRRSDFLFALELLNGVRVGTISVAIDHVRGNDLGRGYVRREPHPGSAAVPDSR